MLTASYTFIYLMEQNVWYLLASIPFLLNAKKRKNFGTRLILAILSILALSLGLSAISSFIPYVFYFVSFYSAIITIILLFAYAIAIFCLYEVKPSFCLCIMVSAFGFVNIVEAVHGAFLRIIEREAIIPTLVNGEFIDYFIYVLVRLSVLIFLQFAFKKRLDVINKQSEFTESKSITVLFIFAIIGQILSMVMIAFDGMISSNIDWDEKWSYIIYVVCIYFLRGIFAAMLLFVQMFIYSFEENNRKKIALEVLREKEKEQFQITKETVNAINIKCHDFRHQFDRISKLNDEGDKYIKTLKDNISIYDSYVKTGNNTLDIVLTDKSLLLEAVGIKLLVMINGQRLAFLENSDLYSVFGNLIENAADYLKTVDDIENKWIRINGFDYAGGYVVAVENYCEARLELNENGLPISTKGEKLHHGYGLQSVMAITKSYGGEIKVSTEDNLFKVKLFFPNINK